MGKHVEREVKLAVWPGFRLPDLEGVVDSATVGEPTEKRLEATYYDTPDLRLARSGITLRHRVGDEAAWTLKLPDDGPATVGLVRTEITEAGTIRAGVPPGMANVLTARVRTAVLGPVARLDSTRQSVELRDEAGGLLAEIVDDEVSVLDGRRVALRFREVEVELGEEVPEGLLDELVERLRAAGAGTADQTPKVMRALGPRALDPPELSVPDLDASASAAEVLTAGLVRSVRQLVEHDPGVREGNEDEAVHQARVATRRLRSDLRVFGDLLEPDWAQPLRDELSWLADALGRVRDADVLLIRLRRQVSVLDPADRPAAGSLLELLAAEREGHRVDLLDVLSSRRYVELLDRLVDAATSPHVLAAAERSAIEVLPQLARRPWAALAKAAGAVRSKSGDEQLHRVRILAKRARYASDVAALVVGKPARRLAGAIAEVQDVLGEHQDACVARAWLRHAVVDAQPAVALVAGQLMQVQRADADARRAELPAVWADANKGKLRAWLTQ